MSEDVKKEESVEETVETTTEETQEESQEVSVAIDKVALAEDEELRIVVTKTTDGAIMIGVKTKEKVEETSLFEIVGLLETAKSDMINRGSQPQGPPPSPNVPIELTAEDFELDPDGQLKAAGKKIGDTLMVPFEISQLREMSIAQLRARKESSDAPGTEGELPTEQTPGE